MNTTANKQCDVLGNASFSGKPGAQQGAVLVLALVMLTVLTLIGVQSMSSSSLELKVAANAQQHNIAFQAAQSRLAFASVDDPANPINFLIAIDVSNPGTWTVQTCDPSGGCPNGGSGNTAWVATAQVNYLDCAKGLGSSLEAGKGFSYRMFEITAIGETSTSSARSTQVGAVRYPVKDCGDETL
jgi:Tfp pilus assembly protein PilX